MKELQQICDFLDQFAPLRLAEDWDNVGLLVGDKNASVQRIMTCLTVTPESATEAIEKSADVIVSHHPLPFHPIKKLTTETTPTKILWDLIRNGIAIYSPHTGFDSAAAGINQMVCEKIGLEDIKPLVPLADEEFGLGAGRVGRLKTKTTLSSLIESLKAQFLIEKLQFVGDPTASVLQLASACGSGGSFLEQVAQSGCDTFITGEASFHTCLESKARNISLVLVGHYSSERFAVEALAQVLQTQFPELEIWPSDQESDPIHWG